MALGLDFGTIDAGDGDSLLIAFTKINTFLSTTTKLSAGDLTINDVRVGRGAGNISSNTAVGSATLTANTTGTYNSAFGLGSLLNNQGGSYNTSFGGDNLFYNLNGNLNSAFGKGALVNATGSENTAIGGNAGTNITNQSNVTCVGYNAQATASNQVVIGDTNVTTTILRGAVTADKDATFNDVRVGRGAGNIVNNTVVGNNALAVNTGINNTAIGNSALAANTNGDYNTAVGLSALQANVTGTANTAIGNGSAVANQGGNSNTSLGSDSLFTNISGNGNTAIGKGALQNNTSSDNTAVGSTCLVNNTIGTLNTAVGNSSLLYNTQGTHNSAFGYASLLNNATGINNTALGREALNGVSSFNNCTGLGYNAQVTASDQIQLGSGTTTCYTNGALQNRSDIRDKAEVRNTILGLDFINELRPVDYKWDIREDYKTEMPTQGELSDEDFKIVMDEWLESVKLDNLTHDGTNTRTRYHHGLIAQEVKDVIEASGVDFGGFQDHSVNGGQDVLSIGYTELIAPMIKAIQELTARINVLEGN